MKSPGHAPKPVINTHESISPELSSYDHAPRFMAFEQHQEELTVRLETLLANSEPQPIEVDALESHLLLSSEEISKLWGLFPASARARAVPNPPVIKTDSPRWIAHGSSSEHPVITDKIEEALSPTSHGMAHTDTATGVITMHEIPENGFSNEVKRLVQAGVIVHELAHTIVNSELWNPDPEYRLTFPTGKAIPMRDWFAVFAQTAEQYPPISRYSSAYRNEDNTFLRQGESLVLGVGVNEELTDSIAAELLSFVVTSQGLTFEPFKNHEELQKGVQAYLMAEK